MFTPTPKRSTTVLTIYLMALTQTALPVLARGSGIAADRTPAEFRKAADAKPRWSRNLERTRQDLLKRIAGANKSAPALVPGPTGGRQLQTAAGALQDLVQSFQYDAKGNLIQQVDANGNVVFKTYDELDRLVRTEYPDGSFVELGYDANGNRTSLTDSTGTTRYTYDDLDRPTQITYPDGRQLDIYYDNLSRIRHMWYVDGTDVYFTYDRDGRILTVDREGSVTSFTYNGAGRIESKTFANGCRTLYHYDAYGRLDQIRHEGPGGQLISQFDYTLDVFGNRTRIVKTMPGPSMVPPAGSLPPFIDYLNAPDAWRAPAPDSSVFTEAAATITEAMIATYDAMDRLTSVNYPDGRTVSYAFDDFNNRTSKTEVKGAITTVTTYDYDVNNRLLRTRINGNVDEEFTWDGNGNMTARKRFGQVTRYLWDFENRLIGVIKPSGERVEYDYNAEDNLWQRTSHYLVGQRTTNFYTTDSADMPMILNEYTHETGRIAAHAYAGETILESAASEGDDTAYASYLVGEYNAASITEIRDSGGALEFALNYPDVYGPAEPKVVVGTLSPGYTGEFYDTESNLQYLRARFYDPHLGTFISQDKNKGEIQSPRSLVTHYVYGDANPLNRIDRGGQYATWVVVTAAVLLVTSIAYNIGLSLGFHEGGKPTSNSPIHPLRPPVDPYGEWRAAPELQWRRPGGVKLDKSVSAYFNIGEIAGATFDPETGQIVMFGKNATTSHLPGMRMDDLAVAIKMIFDHGVSPEISLDPVPGEDWHHKWRYGPPDRPSLMDDTHIGWVMMEADRVLKYLTLGRDPAHTSESLPAGFIPGYRSYVDRSNDYPCQGNGQRFWIHPDEIAINRGADGSTIEFVHASMMCSTETMAMALMGGRSLPSEDANRDGKVASGDLDYVRSQLLKPVMPDNWWADVNHDGAINARDMALVRNGMAKSVKLDASAAASGDPAADDFVAWFNTHWQELRNYDFTPGNPDDPNIFQELEALAKVYGVVKWIKDNNIPFDTSWVATYDVFYSEHDTPQYNNTIKLEARPCVGGTFTITGGVSLCKTLQIDGETVPPPVLSNRPAEGTMGWTFVDPRNGQTYNAAAVSVARTEKDGAVNRMDTDLSLDGKAGKIELPRSYSSFDAAYYPGGWNWDPITIRPKGKGVHQISCNATIAFAPAGVYLAQPDTSREFRFAGTYDDTADPQAIMQFFPSFNPAADVMAYFDAGLLGDPYFFFKDGTVYADFPSLNSTTREGPRSGWLFKNRTNDEWMYFNPAGQLVWKRDSHSNQTDYTRDGSGLVTSISDGTASITLTYNGSRPTRATASNGTYVDYGYWANGLLMWSRLDTGQQLNYFYDADGLLQQVRDENSVLVSGTTNDAYGRAGTTQLLGYSNPFNKDFNLSNRTTVESGPLGTWATQYNEKYLPTRATDPLGHETQTVWNDYKQLITRTEADTTSVERRTDNYYYSNGDLLAARRPNGVVELTLRDGNGRITKSRMLAPSTTFLTSFDAQHIYRGGSGIDAMYLADAYDYAYTLQGKLASKTAVGMAPDYVVSSYTYDGQGRVHTLADGEGHVSTYLYDGALARILRVTNQLGEYSANSYDGRGRVESITNGILPIWYEYDSRDRVSAMVQGQEGGYADPGVRHRSEYTFDPVHGLLLVVKSPNQVLTQYTYDAYNRLWKIVHAGRQIYEYEYDQAGRVTLVRSQGTVGGQLLVEKGWFYDINADGQINEGDLNWFATGWGKPADDPSIQYPPNARFGMTYDYNLDGIIGPADLSFFATGWGLSPNDPRIVAPPAALTEPR